jgi:Cof subfamily protein (haloacid dehalogenase superfamily)
MPYHLLALDLDGTSVVDGRPPTPAVREAVLAAQAAGVHVILATGRSFVSASKFAAAFGLQSPLICFQGALVKEMAGDQATLAKPRTLLAESLPQEPLDEVIALAEEWELELTLYSQQHTYIARMNHPQAFYDLWFGLPLRRAPDLWAARRMLEAEEGPVIKGLFIGEPEDNDRLMVDLEARFAGRLGVMRSHPLFAEVLPPNASKGNALAFLARRFGVPREQTIACGDSGNDLSMVQWAGLGVAMANATPDVLAAADWIAPSVHEDGVVAVIERFILNSELRM